MSQQNLHVVFGGTGGAGAAVLRELLRQGRAVRVVSRRGAADVPAGVEVVVADLRVAEQARRAAAGASVIYNCTNAPYTAWPEQFPPLWRAVTDAAAWAGARLVVIDNLYMYGASTTPLEEASPYRATGRKGRTRIAMVDELLEAHQGGRAQVVVGRAADYFGPGVTLSFCGEALFQRALRGRRLNGFGDLDQPHAVAYIDDVARGLVALGDDEAAYGQIWHLPHAPAPTQRSFLELISAQADQGSRIGATPMLLLRAAALVLPIARELLELDYQYLAPFEVDSGKFERRFGWRATPLEAAVTQTLAWVAQRQLQPRPAPARGTSA